MPSSIPFDQFCKEWLSEIESQKTTVQRGRRFCLKLMAHRFDLDEEAEDLPDGMFYCDGSADGGIDLAYLDVHEQGDPDGGDTWYLVQSKYGTAFQGSNTILTEGRKVIETITGQRRERLSSLSGEVLARITEFQKQASDRDRLVLLFATVDELTEAQKRAIDDVRAIGRARWKNTFEVEHVSLQSVYEAETAPDVTNQLSLTLNCSLAASGDHLLVGTVALNNLYEFLRSYRAKTQEIDRIFERNVRRFLGSRGKVNKNIESTLNDTPERFGLFNNGITFVVTDFTPEAGAVRLINPHIVNGCQTTRSVWNVFERKLNSGGTAPSARPGCVERACESWGRGDEGSSCLQRRRW